MITSKVSWFVKLICYHQVHYEIKDFLFHLFLYQQTTRFSSSSHRLSASGNPPLPIHASSAQDCLVHQMTARGTDFHRSVHFVSRKTHPSDGRTSASYQLFEWCLKGGKNLTVLSWDVRSCSQVQDLRGEPSLDSGHRGALQWSCPRTALPAPGTPRPACAQATVGRALLGNVSFTRFWRSTRVLSALGR